MDEFKKDRIRITDESLRLVGFKRHQTVIVDTQNYIKGDFKMNTALPTTFFYKGEAIGVKIKYMDELIAIYEEKTGENIIKMDGYIKEKCIEFANWLKHTDNGTEHYNPLTKEKSGSIGFSPYDCYMDNIYSVEKLFDLFTKENNKEWKNQG